MSDLVVVIRNAGPADRDSIWPLARDFANSFAVDRDTFNTTLDAIGSDQTALLLVAEKPAAGVVGYLLATSHLTLFANGPVAWVEEVMVDQHSRRAGVGRRLMNTAEEWATSAGAAYIALATRRADQFYRAMGYEDSAVFFRRQLN